MARKRQTSNTKKPLLQLDQEEPTKTNPKWEPSRTEMVVTQVLAVLGLGLGVVSLFMQGENNRIARLNSPENVASETELSFCISEVNTLTPNTLQPQMGALVVKISNESSRPARNVSIVFNPISDDPRVTSENCKTETRAGPFDLQVVDLDCIPPKSVAIVDIKEMVETYPPNFGQSLAGGTESLKYQYCPQLTRVTMDGKPIPINHNLFMRMLNPLDEDGGMLKAAEINWPRH